MALFMAKESSLGVKLLERVREFGQRHWRGVLLLRGRFRLSEETFHLLLAGVIGILGGLVHLLYHELSSLVQWVAFGKSGSILELARHVEPTYRVVVVSLGAFAAGLTLYYGLRWFRGAQQGSLLEVVAAGDGRLSFRPALVRVISSAISLSTGASIGREGLIIHATATVSSKFGQLALWPPYRLRLLVACGAAAGMAAAFDAPVAGAVFAAQIVLGNFSMRTFAPLVFSSVIAAMMSRRFFGIEQWYVVPTFEFTRLGQLPWFVVLGVLAGAAGAMFLKLLGISRKYWEKTPLSLPARILLAGLLVGGLATAFPEVLGNGYEGTSEMLDTRMDAPHLMCLFAAKLFATAICVGAGMVGGVFTPTLFLGAAIGCALGAGLHWANLGGALPIGAFGLAGMGGVLAATTHSPLLAIIMVFELSLNYSLMPALMLACVTATLVSRRLHPDSVYTEPLRQRGLFVERDSSRLGAALETAVGDLMRPPVPPLREHATFREVAARFLASSYNFLPVVDADGRLLGVVALQDLKEHLHDTAALDSVIAYDLMRPAPPCLTPDQRLSEALPILLKSELRNVPVVNNWKELKLIGSISRSEALGLCSEILSASTPSH